MPDEWVEITLPAPKGQEDRKYRLKFSNGLLDIQRERECTDARGKVNDADLWTKRLVSDVEGMTHDKLSILPRWELNGLCAVWNIMNNVDDTRFLELYEKVLKPISPHSTSSSS